MIYFLICADEAVGRQDCAARGWTQVGAGRFYTSGRDDVRLARRFIDMMLLPGGTWFIAGSDFAANPDRDRFEALVESGAAKWAKGGRPKRMAQLTPVDEPQAPTKDDRPFNPALSTMGVPSTRDAWPPRTASTGARRGRPPLPR